MEALTKETIRQAVLSRDNHRCIECGSSEELNVHHVLPEKFGGQYKPENLITLCRTCHSTKHIEYQTSYFFSTVYKIYNRFLLLTQLPLKRDYSFVLKLLTSQNKFRKYQKEVIGDIVSKKDVLAVMATGSGKSVCFQIPGILLNNLTLVITPLKSLMKDQVESLWKKGIPATFINSDLENDEKERRLDLISKGMFKFVYVAPEQFFKKNNDYCLKLEHSLLQNKYDLLVIDEAHCIVEWGRSFRPSYALLNNLKNALGNPTTIALTASASKKAQKTICKSLNLSNPSIYVTGFYRPEITLTTKIFYGDKENIIDQKLEFITHFTKDNPDEKIIIFVPTIKIGINLWKKLVKEDIETEFFCSKSHVDDKTRIQDEYKGTIKSDLKVLICTSAFGMGVNITDIHFCIHWNIPENIEGYYQQMGRIGRDYLPSKAILLYGKDDEGLIRYITNKSLLNNPKKLTMEEKDIVRKIQEQELQTMLYYVNTSDKWKFILNYFGDKNSSNRWIKIIISVVYWFIFLLIFKSWFFWISVLVAIIYFLKNRK